MTVLKRGVVLPILGLVSGLAPVAIAQLAGTFTAVGNMSTARLFHTATLLQDGRVLIAGGFDDDRAVEAVASAELYDPSTGKFTGTGNMNTSRAQHTATLLPNGTVLIAGGDGAPASAELYDPSTGTFSVTGTMNTPRVGHTATLLSDGRVLIAAGSSTATNSAELYDPSTGTFTPTGSLYTAPYGLTAATLLPDGRVLIREGSEAEAELYDPRAATFSKTSPRIPWVQGSAALLMNGKVLLAGGNDDPGESAVAEVYDPSTGTFTATGNMTVSRADDPATLLSDGTILIAGSNGDAGVTLASAELYDPVTGTFTRTGDMTADRGLHTATLLNNGKVLIAGGIHNVGYTWPPLSSADLYTPASVIPAPVLFSLSGDPGGQGAIWHSTTGEIASAGNPAVAGEALSMYTNNLMDGAVIPPQVIVGGRLAEILYFGAAPDYPGYYQVNFRVPTGVAPAAAVPVGLNYIGRASNAVTIGVR
jgi:hypothetical protein